MKDIAGDKPRVCILTIDPASRGGVWHLVRSMYRLHEMWDIQAQVIFQPLLPGRYGVRHISRWKSTALSDEGIPMLALPRPFTRGSPIQLSLVAGTYSHMLRRFAAWIVISGSSNVGLPFALMDLPYIVWVATKLSDELDAQASLDPDSWAGRAPQVALRLLSKIEGFVHQRSRKVVVTSAYTLERLATNYPSLKGKLSVIGTPVDTEECVPDPNVRTEPPMLIFSGRLDDPRKNLNLLLESFRLVLSEVPWVRLLLVGTGSSLVTDRVRKFGLSESVVFTSYVPRHELIRLYQSATLFVLPSKQEGFGVSMVEAMACGLPVVSTRCGGPETIVQDGHTGFLVPNDAPQAMARAIVKLLRDPELCMRLGAQARDYVQSNFSWPVVAEKFRSLLGSVFPTVYG